MHSCIYAYACIMKNNKSDKCNNQPKKRILHENICVSTYCEWLSYGSVMRAIRLKKCLPDLGYDSFIVRDIPAPLLNKTFPFPRSFNLKTMIKGFLSIKARKQRNLLCANSVRFIQEHLDIRYFNDYSVLCKCVPYADCYLAGSNQIWHQALCKQAFFLDFLPSEKRDSLTRQVWAYCNRWKIKRNCLGNWPQNLTVFRFVKKKWRRVCYSIPKRK